MAGNPEKCNHNLYYHYHQDQGHTTEDCRNLWDHLDQLIQEGKLKHLLHHSNSQSGQTNSRPRRDDATKPPIGTINVIFVALGRTDSCPSRIMFVARLHVEDSNSKPKRARTEIQLVLGFSNQDKVGTMQPHDDALVVTLRIGGYDVKRVMVDQGNSAEIMYLDLYKGLNLKPEDLMSYISPLISFDGKMVVSRGQIRLHIQLGSETMEVDFIVVDAYSPYTAIMGRPWLHVLGAVSSTSHQKVKFPLRDLIEEIVGS
nr:uncharacterized protein LOC112000788 [Quercus suber]